MCADSPVEPHAHPAVSARFEEPTLPAVPPWLRRLLLALWVSLAVHVAVIGLVRIAPSGSPGGGETVLQVRLDPAPAATEPAPVEEPDEGLQAADTLKPTETLGAAAQSNPVKPASAASATAVTPTPVAPSALPPNPPASEPGRDALSIDPAVDLTYYTARQLDAQPVPRGEIDPVYPPEADRLRQSGSVRVQVKVEADGRVSAVEVVESTPPGVFDASAMEAFRAARFQPGQKAGRPVRALMLIEVTYDWAGRRP